MPNAPVLLLPADLAGHTVESLPAAHPPRWPLASWFMIVAVAAALASLPCLTVDTAVRAPGVVRPVAERIDLRAPVSGHVIGVFAHDNDAVRSGQPLLELASPELDERLVRNRELQAARRDLADDLRTLTGDDDARPLEAMQAVAGLRTAALNREHEHLLARLAFHRLEEIRAREEWERLGPLATRGLVARRDLDHARYEAERLDAEAVSLFREELSRWQARLREEEMALDDLASEAARLRAARDEFTIHAPVEGRLIGFNGWGVGGFISAGQPLGSVSPSDRLLVEAAVSPRDVGLIEPGQPVRLQVDAYPYTQWGTLDGTVLSVSADLLVNASGGNSAAPWFKVLVRPSGELRLPNGLRAGLKKGLTVQARFLVARRTLLQLLCDGASRWLDPRAAPRPHPPLAQFNSRHSAEGKTKSI